MTFFYFNDKISVLFLENRNNSKIKIFVEGNAVLKQNSQKPHCKQIKACLSDLRMENMGLNLTKLTNYFVQLFYKTNQRYSCTRTKIGKLLSIFAFEYACEGKRAFKETIHKYDDCGTAIYEIMERFTDRDIYTKCAYEDKISTIPDDYFYSADDSIIIPNEYMDVYDLDKDVLSRIEKVFKAFGSYSPTELGECINPIVNCDGVVNNYGEVKLERLEKLTYEDFKKYENMSNLTLIQYLFKS